MKNKENEGEEEEILTNDSVIPRLRPHILPRSAGVYNPPSEESNTYRPECCTTNNHSLHPYLIIYPISILIWTPGRKREKKQTNTMPKFYQVERVYHMMEEWNMKEEEGKKSDW